MPVSRLKKSHVDILRVLREEKAPPAYIAEKTGYSRDTVRKRLVELRKWGYVERVRFGFYTITKKGLKVLESDNRV